MKRETGGTFKIDDEIEGNYQGYGRWFKGSISYVNKDGTYDVQYADGDQETSVSPSHLRFPARNNKDSPKKDKILTSGIRAHEFKPGDEIEGDFKGRGRWYRGKIDVVNKDGTYDVRYDDGDSERGVRGYCIRGVKQYRHDDKKHGPSVLSSSSSRSSTYKIGDPVKANYKYRGLWLEGKICQVNGDGTYTVQFHNGNIEKGVVDSDLVSFNAAPQIGFLNKKNRRDPESLNLKCDEEVIIPDDGTIEGKKGKGKGRWYNKGKVARMNINGTHDVQYDDCEVQTKVAGPKKKERFNVVGDIVECNYRGKGKWFKGQIFEINADGTYDILYDDGDRENSVERFNIRNIQKSSSNNSSSGGERDIAIKGGDSFRTCGDNDDDSMLLFQVGDNIEANFRGRGTWYEGTIVKKNNDGTFHVRYADGDEEYFVEQHLIRRCKRDDDLNDEPPALEHSINSPLRYHISSHGGDARESNANRATTLFCVGEEVQGNYKGKGKWYKCKIKKVNKDGTYRVKYVNGDVEDHVKVKGVSSSSTGTTTTKVGGGSMNTLGCCSEDIASVEVGDDVEGNYKGKGRWIRGIVTHTDHQSYDICYKTGIEEFGVAPSNIRPLGHVCNKSHHRKSTRRDDDDDESDIDSGSRVLLANTSDTGDHYSYSDKDDNDENSRSSSDPLNIIRRSAAHHHMNTSKMSHVIRSSNNLKAEKNLELFDVIEANYKGTGRWLRGIICCIREDGLYDVLYDNNKRKENYVKAHNIRFISHHQPKEEVVESEPKALQRKIGDKVEVNYKGKGKWRSGIIRSSVHGDGSYSIQYAAGGGTEDVFPSNIRSIMSKRLNGSQRKRISDSESDKVVQPRHPSSQRARQRSPPYAKLAEGRSARSETDSEELNSLDDVAEGNVRLVSERLWSVLNSVVHGGVVDVKRAPRGILRMVFESVDKDDDGLITSLQLYRFLKQLGAPILDLDGGYVDDLFQVMDYDQDGLFSLRDIVEFALWDAKGNVPSDIWPMYKRLAEEATKNMKLLSSSGKEILGHTGGGVRPSVVDRVEDALSGNKAKRWSELPHRLAKVGIHLRSRDVDALEGLLDTKETGRVPNEIFAVWLCSGLDMSILKLKTGHLLRELEERGVDPKMVLKQAHKRSGGKGRGRTISESTFIEGLRMLSMPLTHSQICGLISLLSMVENDDDSSCERGFDYNSPTSKQMKEREIDVMQFLALSGEQQQQQQLLHSNDKTPSKRWKGLHSKSETATGTALRKRVTVDENHEKIKMSVNNPPDCSNEEHGHGVVSEGEGGNTSNEIFSSDYDDCGNNNSSSSTALFDKKTLKALWSLAIEDASKDSTLRDAFKNSKKTTNSVPTGEMVVEIPIKRCEKVLRKRLGSKTSKKQLNTVLEFLEKFQEIKTNGTVRQGSRQRMVLIPLLDIMELSLSRESSNDMLADLHNRMANDLALKVKKKQQKRRDGFNAELGILVNIISIATKPFKSFDKGGGNSGFVTSKAFKKGLTKLDCGKLMDHEKTYLVQHFDVNKEGVVNYVQFGIWLASGLDSERLESKMRCLQRILKAKYYISTRSALKQMAKKEQNNIYGDNSSIIIAADKMAQYFRQTLGFPLTQGEMRMLIKISTTSISQSEEDVRDGGIDIDLLPNGIRSGKLLLRQQNKYHSTSDDMSEKSKDQHREQSTLLLDNNTHQKSGTTTINHGHRTTKQQHDTTNNKHNTTLEVIPGNEKNNKKHSKGKRNEHLEMRSLAATVQVKVLELMSKGGCDMDWEAKFEGCSGAVSGFVSLDDTVHVIVQTGIPVSSSQKAVLGKRMIGEDNEIDGNSGLRGGKPPSISTRSIVRWLEACSEIDINLLWNVQHYFTGRLSKSFSIRDLFSEITAGRKHLTPKRLTKVLKGTKAQLSRVVIELLVDMFDDDGDGSLSFSEFQKLVYSNGAHREESGRRRLS